MKSLRELYKIGRGPSSSHTIGPERATKSFLEETPEADHYKAILYESFAKTGKGHGTDRVIETTISPRPVEIVFNTEAHPEMHPNTLDLIAYKGEEEFKRCRVESVGGGNVVIDGKEALSAPSVYPENSMAEIIRFCQWRYITLDQYVELNEGPEIWEFFEDVWNHMKASVEEGLVASGVLPGGLHLERKAKILLQSVTKDDVTASKQLKQVCAYAFAVAEQNADNGTVVTAPTCGSCGVVPAVLYYSQKTFNLEDREIWKALAVGGLFGNIVRRNASISGAECGCQAEIGTATSMAAAALVALAKRPMEVCEYAAEIAMEHSLGLTCDPICGLVQIPCIERNAVAAKRAIDSASLADILSGTRNMSFDMVVRTMHATGIRMHQDFRETAEGGLARYYSRRGEIKK